MFNFKTLVGLVALGAAGLLLTQLPAPSSAQSAAAKLPPGVVAKVGERLISAEEVLARINEVEKTLGPPEQRLRQAYWYLMYLEILRAEARRLEMVVTEELRRETAKKQIEGAKAQLKSAHSGQLPWAKYLAEIGFTEESFEEMVYIRAEQVLLKRWLVWHWEFSTAKVRYLQITARSELEADEIVARVDAEMKQARAEIAKAEAANPGEDGEITARAVFWPTESEYAHPDLTRAFMRVATREARTTRGLTQEVFAGQPLRDEVRDLLFTKLKPGEHTGAVKLDEGVWVIVMLDARSPGSKLTFAEMRESLNDRPDPNDAQYERWARAVLTSGRYDVAHRIPGEPQTDAAATPTPGAPEEKPSEGAPGEKPSE